MHIKPAVLFHDMQALLRIEGEGRNRTESSPTASLNTLIYKAILTLILKGFKRFLALHATYRT
jgi:hypothetical protein